MTEYTANSAHHGSDSVTRAHRIGRWVHVTSQEQGKRASTALNPDTARTFARGILDLADEIDGGAVKEAAIDVRPEVGDRVRVVEDDRCTRPGQFVGKIGTLRSARAGGALPYYVEFDESQDAPYRFWHVAKVELVDVPESADEPAPAPKRTPKVGDRVRVTGNAFDYESDENVGAEGVLLQIDPDEQPYKVSLNGDVWWCAEVEVVPESTPAPSTFAHHVDEAKRLLNDTDHSGADVIRLAEILAQQ